MEETENRCATCYGEGQFGTEYGIAACPDCSGVGSLPSPSVLRERRLRDLERAYAGQGQTERDMRFLVDEIRNAQDALVKIMGLAMDAGSNDEVANRIRFLANQALELYPVVAAD